MALLFYTTLSVFFSSLHEKQCATVREKKRERERDREERE